MVIVEDILNRFGQRIVEQIILDVENKQVTSYGAVNASGRLAKSIRYEVKDGTLKIYANDYIYYLVYGRKPGTKPPHDVIVQWIKDKSKISNNDWASLSEAGINSLAWMIRNKIGEKGTIIYQQGGSTLLDDSINRQLISDLSSDLFNQVLDASLTYFRSNVLPNIAA